MAAREPGEVEIVPAGDVDPTALVERVRGWWGSDAAAGHGSILYPARERGFVARLDGRLVGHAAYRVEGDRCELVAIVAEPPGRGIGSALLARVEAAAREAGCGVVWMTTTNDNLGALRFYQRHGYRLAALRPGAVDDARSRLKPEIPLIGEDGIPIHDELDLERSLDQPPAGDAQPGAAG